MAKEIVEVPLTGKILSVNVKVGDKVKEDDVICVLESMKMENPIVAPVAGKITQIGVSTNETVEAGKMIAVIEY
ncbi:MAG: biotin/lipoyl-binding protein [Dehalococcoidales bacterium]|nr:biotin/lipoyl-binding protein [Dehalococcoidales bacterium]